MVAQLNYINPIELLDLKHLEINQIDGGTIKKAKKRIFADFDLSDDGDIKYYNRKITRAECEKVFIELDDSDNIEFYHFLANKHALNKFLVDGDPQIFNSFPQESIYKLPAFIDFVSPYYSTALNLSLLKAFKDGNKAGLQKLLSVTPLVNSNFKDACFKGINSNLKQSISDVNTITTGIKNEDSIYDEDNCNEAFYDAKEILDVELINSLPNYFQSLRNQSAQALRNLSVNIFNSFHDSETALETIEYALEFKIDDLIKQKIEKDYQQIQEINEEREAENSIGPLVKKYASVMVELKEKLDGIEKRTELPLTLVSWANKSFDVGEINSLDDAFDQIKEQLALGLRALSVGVWNTYNDIEVAMSLISKASQIRYDNLETKKNIQEAKQQIDELKRKVDLANTIKQQRAAQFSNQTSTTSSSGTKTYSSKSSSNNSGCLVLFGIAAVIGIIALIANSNNHSSYSSPSYTPPSNNSTPINSDPINSNNTSVPIIVEQKPSKYKGNSLKDGSSPLDKCFGKGKFSGSSWILFKNSNLSDAVVCLVNVNTNKTVRNEYIRAGSDFKMTSIPSGTYYLKVLYGNDWNPNLENFCGVKGNFESNVHCSKSDSPGDYITVNNSESGYTTGEITLYTVSNGNMQQQDIGESEFFK
jgi:hypothetical protein